MGKNHLNMRLTAFRAFLPDDIHSDRQFSNINYGLRS